MIIQLNHQRYQQTKKGQQIDEISSGELNEETAFALCFGNLALWNSEFDFNSYSLTTKEKADAKIKNAGKWYVLLNAQCKNNSNTTLTAIQNEQNQIFKLCLNVFHNGQ